MMKIVCFVSFTPRGRELEHCNVIRLLGQCSEMQPMLMIMECAALVSLNVLYSIFCFTLESFQRGLNTVQWLETKSASRLLIGELRHAQR